MPATIGFLSDRVQPPETIDGTLYTYAYPQKPCYLVNSDTYAGFFATGETVRFKLGNLFGPDLATSVEAWRLIDQRDGTVLFNSETAPTGGGGFAVTAGAYWTHAALQGLPQGAYLVDFRLAAGAVNPGKWAIHGRSQGGGAFIVADFTGYETRMPRPPATETDRDTVFHWMIGDGARVEFRWDEIPMSTHIADAGNFMAQAATYLFPFYTTQPITIFATFANFQNLTGQAADVTSITALSLWDDLPDNVSVVFCGTNEANNAGTPEGGMLGGGAVVTIQNAFSAAVIAGRPEADDDDDDRWWVGSASPVRLDVSARAGGTLGDWYTAAPHFKRIVTHEYSGSQNPAGLDLYYEGYRAFVDTFGAYAGMPILVDEVPSSAAKYFGLARPCTQAHQLIAQRFARLEAWHTGHLQQSYFFVVPRGFDKERPIRSEQAFPAALHYLVDSQEHLHVDPATVTRVHCGTHDYVFRAHWGVNSDNSRVFAVLPFQAGARMRLHLPGVTAGTVLDVRSGWGTRTTVTVAAGSLVDLAWDDMAARYLHLPAGVTPAYVEPYGTPIDPTRLAVEYIGASATPLVQGYGRNLIANTIRGPRRDPRADSGRTAEAEAQPDVPWASPDTLGDDPDQKLRIHFLDGPHQVTAVLVEGPAVEHQGCAPREGRVESGGQPVATFDIPHVEYHAPNPDYDAVALAFGDGTAATALPDLIPDDSAPVAPYMDLVITRTTAGGAPSWTSATMGGTTVDYDPSIRMGVGNGQVTDERPNLVRVTVWATPDQGGVTGYLVTAPPA